jgi:Lrp/AsnC family transcriptional regulator, leucine-responsive regulatory protein
LFSNRFWNKSLDLPLDQHGVAFSRTGRQHLAMDELDHRILDVLRRNARISNRDLAATVNLSPSPCLRRVRRLEKSGVIRGYRADIREPESSQPLCVFVGVRVRHHAGEHVRRFVSEVIKLPEVVECHHVTGDLDYLLRVEVPDLAAYEEFHANKLADIPGIGTVTSYVAMTTVVTEG